MILFEISQKIYIYCVSRAHVITPRRLLSPVVFITVPGKTIKVVGLGTCFYFDHIPVKVVSSLLRHYKRSIHLQLCVVLYNFSSMKKISIRHNLERLNWINTLSLVMYLVYTVYESGILHLKNLCTIFKK